jgi:hypothetical protein
MKTYKTEPAMNYASKVKTFDVRLPITGKDLGLEVREAFALAKSSGRELTIYFSAAAASSNLVHTPKIGHRRSSDSYSCLR